MPNNSKAIHFNRLLLLGIFFASIAVFIIDIQFPLGVAGDIPYALFIMATYWTRQKSYILASGILATLLVVLGFLLSEPSDYMLMTATVRVMSIIIIWGSVWFVIKYLQSLDHIRKDEKRMSALFKATTDEIMVFQIDTDMNPLPFLEVNEVACEILGYTREELLQKTLYDIVATDKEHIKQHLQKVIMRGESLHESKHLTKEGEGIPLEISARSFTYSGRQTIISIGRDVRERRKLEQEILNISEQERQRIGRDMHDDLGQMLTGTALIAQNLATKLKSKGIEDAPKVQKITNMIREADEHARALARGLVPVNVESNGLDIALQELARKSTDLYDVEVQYSRCHCKLFDDNSSAVHLYRIAQEAINNAIKHSEATRINVELAPHDDHILLTVSDNGVGLQVQNEKNNGMGLRIMKFRAQMIGGSLEMKSESGKGTEIICKVPQNHAGKA